MLQHVWRHAWHRWVRRVAALVATVTIVGALTPAGSLSAAGAGESRASSVAALLAASGDGWQLAAPGDEGMDAETLHGTCDYAMQPQRHTQGVVVIRGGKVVDECYADGEGVRSWAASWSVAKSFASTLVGIAIAQGQIPSLDVSMATYYPEWSGTPKEDMTFRDVVTMSSGLAWNEDYNPTNTTASDVIQMGLSGDQLAYAASRPLAHTPGTRWAYSSGDAMLLSGVIQKATGMAAGDYAQQVLFEPLGISQVEWWKDAAGHTLTYCCLDMTSRSYARLGLLFLNDGNWGGEQIVPAQWVTDAFTTVPDSDGQYGFMWWIGALPGSGDPVYMADGFDLQLILVIPSLDLVVVRNSDYVKSECPAIADPNLFSLYPPLNLIPGQGTRPPDDWDSGAFLQPILDSITGASSDDDATPSAGPAPDTRFPDGQATATCPEGPTVPVSTTPTADLATVSPRFTG